MADPQLLLDQLRQTGYGRSGAEMRLFSIPLLTTASAEVVTKWFAATVTPLGGTVKMVAWPQEVVYEDLLAGWQYDLVANDADAPTECLTKRREIICPLSTVCPPNQNQP